MKALFIHDHPFIKNPKTGILYTSGNLSSELWNRYLKHFSSLTVIGRCHMKDETENLLPAESENVEFNLFYDVKGGKDYFLKRSSIANKVESEIDKHDIVVLRFPSIISMYAAQYCIRNNRKYIVEVVGCAWDANWNFGGLLPKLIAPLTYFYMKKHIKSALASIYVTKSFLQKRYPNNSKITSHASNVILKRLDENSLVKRITNMKSYDDKSCISIGIIGNLNVRYKGHDVLLKAISILPQDTINRITIFFVGGGDCTYLESLINKYQLETQCKILGKLKSGDEIFAFLDKLDIYIHPSKQEGLPRSVIEAMSRACPILASSVAGVPELISEDCLHKPGDFNKLSEDIQKLIDSVEIQEKLAIQNFSNSKDYLFPILEARRERFFKEIKSFIKL